MNPLLEFKGIVLKGNQLGRTIGFPTANLKPPPGTQFPIENGVYA
ncbi:MAG: riboflavin kinase, partial [Bacteroidota bacterium]